MCVSVSFVVVFVVVVVVVAFGCFFFVFFCCRCFHVSCLLTGVVRRPSELNAATGTAMLHTSSEKKKTPREQGEQLGQQGTVATRNDLRCRRAIESATVQCFPA